MLRSPIETCLTAVKEFTLVAHLILPSTGNYVALARPCGRTAPPLRPALKIEKVERLIFIIARVRRRPMNNSPASDNRGETELISGRRPASKRVRSGFGLRRQALIIQPVALDLAIEGGQVNSKYLCGFDLIAFNLV